jgi:hypothetical protein
MTYLIQLKSYFEVSTILTFMYTEIFFISTVHNNYSVGVLLLFIYFGICKDLNEFLK